MLSLHQRSQSHLRSALPCQFNPAKVCHFPPFFEKLLKWLTIISASSYWKSHFICACRLNSWGWVTTLRREIKWHEGVTQDFYSHPSIGGCNLWGQISLPLLFFFFPPLRTHTLHTRTQATVLRDIVNDPLWRNTKSNYWPRAINVRQIVIVSMTYGRIDGRSSAAQGAPGALLRRGRRVTCVRRIRALLSTHRQCTLNVRGPPGELAHFPAVTAPSCHSSTVHHHVRQEMSCRRIAVEAVLLKVRGNKGVCVTKKFFFLFFCAIKIFFNMKEKAKELHLHWCQHGSFFTFLCWVLFAKRNITGSCASAGLHCFYLSHLNVSTDIVEESWLMWFFSPELYSFCLAGAKHSICFIPSIYDLFFFNLVSSLTEYWHKLN